MFIKLQVIISLFNLKREVHPSVAQVISYGNTLDYVCEFLKYQSRYIGDTRNDFNDYTMWAYDVSQSLPVPDGKKSNNMTSYGDAEQVIIAYRSAMDQLVMYLEGREYKPTPTPLYEKASSGEPFGITMGKNPEGFDATFIVPTLAEKNAKN